MNKNRFLTIVFLAIAVTLQAQFAKPLKDDQLNYKSSKIVSLGVTGSYGANDMWYSAVRQSKLHPWFAPTFGIALEWNTMRRFSIGCDALYAIRGTHKTFSTELLTSYSTTSTANVDFTMALKGLELRFPFTYYIGYGETVRPFIFVAPRLEVWIMGDLHWERSYNDHLFPTIIYECDLNKATTAPFDLSAMTGVGLCSKFSTQLADFFVRIEMAYGISLLSNFSSLEKTSQAIFQGWGDIDHENLGERRLQNVEARITVLIPLQKPLEDACSLTKQR